MVFESSFLWASFLCLFLSADAIFSVNKTQWQHKDDKKQL